MTDQPEKKSHTEMLDLEQKAADMASGKRPLEPSYPYITPDYRLPFLHVGAEKQLFLDNFVLDHLEDTHRVISKPRRQDEPVLTAGELPWEKEDAPHVTAVLDDPATGHLRLWYAQRLTSDPFGRHMVLCYAQSDDGIHWEKPLHTSCIPYLEHEATNIVLTDSGPQIGLVLNHDQSEPSRRYLMVYNPTDKAAERGGQPMSSMATSPDGLHWTVISEDTPLRHHHFQRIIWDEAIQRWVGYSQYSHHWNPLHRKRQIGRQESTDFVHWSPKEVVLSVDWDANLPPDLEFHDMSVRKIGGLYVGITGEFMAEPLWCVRDGANWRDFAYARLGLYSSRDGKRWQRVGGPGPWLEAGDPGNFDYGFAAMTAAGQIIRNGRTYICYSASPEKQNWYRFGGSANPLVPEEEARRSERCWEDAQQAMAGRLRRASAIGALSLREDGWAKLSPKHEQGRVYTKQFVFEGTSLAINADCAGGYVRVDALDPNFKPYPGFSAEECDPVSPDPAQIWHTVRWRGNPDVTSLWNKPVRLCLHLHQASAYGFQFQGTSQK